MAAREQEYKRKAKEAAARRFQQGTKIVELGEQLAGAQELQASTQLGDEARGRELQALQQQMQEQHVATQRGAQALQQQLSDQQRDQGQIALDQAINDLLK